MAQYDELLDKAEEVSQTLKEYKAYKKVNQELDRLEQRGTLLYNLLEIEDSQIKKARFLATERADDATDLLRSLIR